MNVKRIFSIALILALISSGLFYFSFLREKPQQASTPIPVVSPQTAKAEEKKKEATLEIKKGKRAMSIPVDAAKGVSGYLQVGSFVDVVTIYDDKNVTKDANKDKKIITGKLGTIVIQNVRVIALGDATQINDEKKKYQLVTLEVTPEEGLALGMAKMNEFYLMLRGEKDGDKSQPVHMNDDVIEKGVEKSNE